MPRSFFTLIESRGSSSNRLRILVIRLHSADKPEEIRRGDYVGISLDKKHWITAKMEPTGDTGSGKKVENVGSDADRRTIYSRR